MTPIETRKWVPRQKDIKKYPHFDRIYDESEIVEYVCQPDNVRKHSFYPFIMYNKSWQPFRSKTKKPDKKSRKIRYSSHRDAAIFAYYRWMLSNIYEQKLQTLNIEESVIAYRRIPVSLSNTSGKCNIHFAKDAFDKISEHNECVAIVLDISGYFDSIDHQELKERWAALLETPRLPDDHFKVFENLTRYAYVEREELYERLGYFGDNPKTGMPGYLVRYEDVPPQLCMPADFRTKVRGDGTRFPSIIRRNMDDYGIPQGAPLSDLLANLYLAEFDCSICKKMNELGGWYRRYSDDILIVVPGDEKIGKNIRDFVIAEIGRHGRHLKIKESKTSIGKYKKNGGLTDYTFIEGAQGKNGIEYLGFRFDGERVFLRDKTVNGFKRKITFAARYAARNLTARFPKQSYENLVERFDRPAFFEKFDRVRDFDKSDSCRKWTFWTYVLRAADIFNPRGNTILKQLAGHKKSMHALIDKEISRAMHTK